MTVHNLVNGCRARNLPAPSRIGSAQARQILAVTPEAAEVRQGNACGSRRRLQALVALGHSPSLLANRLGISLPRMRRLLYGQSLTVNSATHAAVCALYKQLWDVVPADHTQHERATAEIARRRAQRLGWPPPMALDDDRMDDANYRPGLRPSPGVGHS